jgi:hypothetical protein
MTIKKSVAKEFEKEATRYIGDRSYRVSTLNNNGQKSVTDQRQVISKSVYPGRYFLVRVMGTTIYIARCDRPEVVRCVRPEFFREQFGINLPAVLEKLIKEERQEAARMSIREMPDPVSIEELIALVSSQPHSAFA